MILGQYPFLGETLQDTYDKVQNFPLLVSFSTPAALFFIIKIV